MESRARLWLPLCLLSGLTVASAADWPHFRGPAQDGRSPETGGFPGEALGLAVAWKVPLGAGYSGVAVAGGRAVTMFSDGASDYVAAFDAATGTPAWRVRIADAYKGHDGSDDGPASSPAIGDGRVFALGPRGDLLALDLRDGARLWSKRLEQDLGAKAPFYGFGTTPLVEGGLVVVQAGGSDGRAVVALDARTGTTRWAYGEAASGYESPAAMTLAGRRQIVTVSPKSMAGLAVEDGKVLWKVDLGEKDRFGPTTPTILDGDRFLVFQGDGVAVHRVRAAEGALAIEEQYRSTALGNTYAHPVFHDGHVYGFRGQVLTCMRAADGERVWRSREPGGDGLILVDGLLVIFGSKGNVAVARATPEGYSERARTKALGGSALTWPAYADGRIFVRNLDELAAVTPRSAPAPAAVQLAGAGDHEFGRWVRSVEAASDRPARVDALLAKHERMPIVEGDWVHFVWRGEAKDVAIAGSMIDSESADPLRRLEGSDLFYRSYRLEPGTRWEYRFQVDFENWVPDPRNGRTVPALEETEPMSEIALPGYRDTAHLGEPTAERGRIDEFTLKSEALGAEKSLKVWLPPGYDGGDRRYPLLVVQDGESWLDKGLLVNTLDNLVGRSVAPVVVAFVPANRRFWMETGGSRTEDYVRMLAEELVPALEGRYRLIPSAESRALLGTRFYGFSSAYAALRHPQLFGKAAVQSVYLGLGSEDELVALVRAGAGKSVRFYVDWNRYDERSVDRGYDFAEESRRLTGLLRDGGYAVDGGEVLDSYGWSGWRNRSDRVLASLFPHRS